MAVAKIITKGNALTIFLPEGIHFADCDEAEVEMIGSEIRLAPKFDRNKQLFDALTGFSDDFADSIEEARKNFIQSKREDL